MQKDKANQEIRLRGFKHDLANDIGILGMNLEALKLMREDKAEFEELASTMRETLQTLEDRLERLFASVTIDEAL